MEIETGTATKAITINGVAFKVPTPFKDGDVISEGAAHQLNQVLSENVRNNLAGKFKDNPNDLTQEIIDAYITDYEFGERNGGGGGRVGDPVEREAIRIATDKVKEAIRANRSTKLSDYKASELTAFAKKLLDRDDDLSKSIKETAKTNVERSQSVAAMTLEGILPATAAANAA